MIIAMSETVLPLRRASEATTLQEHVAEELRVTMARRRVPQRDLAEALGINAATLSKRLNGQQPMTVDFIGRACVLLGLSPRTLFDWTPPEPGPGVPVSSG